MRPIAVISGMYALGTYTTMLCCMSSGIFYMIVKFLVVTCADYGLYNWERTDRCLSG